MTTIERVELDQVPLLARPYFADGDPGPIVRALAQVPELLTVALPFIGAALAPSAIGFRAKEIVIVRTSALAGCRFCVETHAVVALDAGLSPAHVAALRTPGPVPDGLFGDPAEEALLGWVDVVGGGGPVSDEERAAILRHWDHHEIVELTTVVGATLMLNRFATALALPTSPDALERLEKEGLR
ncbi:carboxymuconolactone decarboxylase family protein [Actinomycetospora lutea]|uniref:carboxymuconolactone decarboxylase family protein n=1 Tax=Actinomycetospora lutea TaxID=663604 RepID=UPI002366F87B|nr:carboxymuconolactone decarboxylase family protein [Actinomycetospora lutea]MDD7941035.1 carboxymuconolactone decarboxylase family protein [Actinomycetospora lutea]